MTEAFTSNYMGLDQQLFLFIQSFTGNTLIDSTMLFFAEALAFLIPVTLVYLWFESRESRRESIFTFVTTVLGIGFTYVMGLFYFHNQPFATYDTIVSGGELDNAFASQHTASMFSVFWSFLYLKHRRLAILFGVTGFLTGLGRIFVGHHYPVDVLGGVFSGLLGLGVAVLLENYLSDELDWLVDKSYDVEESTRARLGF